MVFILVDLEFREKARHYLTTKEALFCTFFLLFALLPWFDIVTLAGSVVNKNGTFYNRLSWLTGNEDVEFFSQGSNDMDDTPTMESSCNPKFPRLCVKP